MMVCREIGKNDGKQDDQYENLQRRFKLVYIFRNERDQGKIKKRIKIIVPWSGHIRPHSPEHKISC